MADNASAASLGKSFRGNNLPVVVKIIMSIAGDLLSLTADTTIIILQRIPLGMRVQVNLGIFVFYSNDVVVTKLCKNEVSRKESSMKLAPDLGCSSEVHYRSESPGRRGS